jgi:hypothetical protein
VKDKHGGTLQLLVAVCRVCVTRHEAWWPGDRPVFCQKCKREVRLKWRFDNAPIDKRDVGELKEWLAK